MLICFKCFLVCLYLTLFRLKNADIRNVYIDSIYVNAICLRDNYIRRAYTKVLILEILILAVFVLAVLISRLFKLGIDIYYPKMVISIILPIVCTNLFYCFQDLACQ